MFKIVLTWELEVLAILKGWGGITLTRGNNKQNRLT